MHVNNSLAAGGSPGNFPPRRRARRAWAIAWSLAVGFMAMTSSAVTGTKTALVMLVSLTDAPIDCSIAEVNGFYFTNSPLNVDSYFDHSTWGNVRWAGNVISVSVNFTTSPCSQDAWANAADAAALAQGFDPSTYTARIYAFPSAAGSCGYALATGNRVMNWHCTDLFAYGHEVGHTIGMHHASTDHDNDGVIDDEYGGLDDCMGGESFVHNAPHKMWGDWLPQRPAANGGWRQISVNGVYQISPLEINPTSNPPFSQALKIISPTGTPYILSYRQALDFDQGWTAAQVGKDGRSGTIVDPTLSMNAYPYSRGVTIHRFGGGTGEHTLEIAVLADNQQFVIPGTGIVIRQTSHNASQVTLVISGMNGGTAPVGVTFYQDGNYGGAQSQVFPAGDYLLSAIFARGVQNDWASSSRIPGGWTVIMYQNDSFGGISWTNTGDTPSFSALSPSANDQMSSVKIIAGPATPPPVSTHLSATAGDTLVNLSWSATPGATSYNVKRSMVNGGPYTTVASPTVSAYANTNLTNGTTYYYVVSAVNGLGESANSSQVSAAPTSDLVARWKFDETSGTAAADSSGNSNTGTLSSSAMHVTPGKVGPAAVIFNPASLQSVTAPSSSSLNNPVTAITIAAWINPTTWGVGANRRILQKGNADNQYRLLAENGVLKFHLSGVDTVAIPLPPTAAWIHIAGTWDGSTMILYTNGVPRTNAHATGMITTTPDVLAIGKKNGSGVAGDYFSGRIDDVRIYNRALSAVEVATIMTNAPPFFASDPVNKPGVNAGQAYAGSISTNASDPDADALTFFKISGPAWLSVASNGTLSGTPATADANTNAFTVRVTDTSGAFDQATLNIYVNSPPSFINDPFDGPAVAAGQAYSASIATNAVDPNPADALAFAKLSGPAWLSVAGDGSLSGTPLSADVGANSFIVSVTDSGSLSNTATLNVAVGAAPPLVSTFAFDGSNYLLSWTGGVGPYQVQMSTNLAGTNWVTIDGPLTTNATSITLSNEAAFYRIMGQ